MNEKQFVLKIKEELIEAQQSFQNENDFIGVSNVYTLNHILEFNIDIDKMMQECKNINITVERKFIENEYTKENEESFIFSI